MRQPVPFGKYLLLDRISVGGMAEVFKAKSYGVEGFEKIIAIKRILPTMGEDRDFIKMFIDEAKIAGQLAHANICQIFELGRIDGSHFIAMEYIWGKDLLQIQNRLRKLKQAMPVSMACFAMAKVLEGLDYAHRKRDPLGRPLEIVHRDCSPQNVLVSYEGEVKVIDFGIAKATSRNSRTMAGVLKGKFGYMSPEQVRGLPLDRRSDIFALGTMLYECLTGDRLFQGETDFSTLEKVRNVDIRPPRELNPEIPEAIERVILKALSKDVDDRYQWCSEMLADLQQYLMSQDAVFTAKTLSGWVKDVFAGDIEKERQQLEQYKRVGRDGLIAGVPSAEAKLDVDEHLGEAEPIEAADATVLGSPTFDDLESVMEAHTAGPAPGSPAARGAPLQRPSAGDDDEDFGEEAPTEIFGEIDHGAAPVAPASAQRPPTPQPAVTTPPRAPPGNRAPTLQPPSYPPSASATSMQRRGSTNAPTVPAGLSPSAPQSYSPYPSGPGPTAPTASSPQALGTPGSMAISHSQPVIANPQTLMGNAPPLATYGQGYPAQGYPQSYPGPGPQNPYPQAGYGVPTHPSGPISYGGGSGQHHMHVHPSGPMAQVAPPGDGSQRTSIARDVAIGVGIAGLVLGGFLAVKFLILDSGSDKGSSSGSTSSIATIKVGLTPGTSADLFVDDKKIATVRDQHEIPVTAGQRRIKLIGPGGARCEEDLKLPPGKTTSVECVMAGSAAGAGSDNAAGVGSGSGSGTSGGSGSAATGGSGSGTSVGSGSAATAGSAATTVSAGAGSGAAPRVEASDSKVNKPADLKKPETKPLETGPTEHPKANRVPDKMPPEVSTPKPASVDEKGYLQLSSKPVAKISVDLVDTGLSTPITGHALSLTPGKHKVTFTIGNDKFTFVVVIKAGATETLSKEF